MFVSIACLTLLQVILYRGHFVEACTIDSECSCPDRKFHARCVDIKDGHFGLSCVCIPDPAVECQNDIGCHCQGDNFHAKCVVYYNSPDYLHIHSFCDVWCPVPHIDQTTTRPTDSTTTYATSTSSPKPTPAPPQSNCSEFDITLHGCHDNSACTLPHVNEVICPDPKEAKYCPTICGCCTNAQILG